ncbi:DUF1343 domain-containing protein [Thermodesulfobacterium sp. TA1]|uniref:exo-beta-N-acetylmuramidase NamZ family protein n=1 Tax=Thermodesulfobacterium sp. TA1 TaxID=2234087 RepID=UPI001232CF8E|nr:DUF1343 domain-containing protein [Thermodesulfobacterium sp. TA1]QER41244.1 DUF1343 domain-containing protein [Thermodesulfobacterium sp. TA1]
MVNHFKPLFGVDLFFFQDFYKRYQGQKIALLCNQASLDYTLTPTFIRFKQTFGKDFKLIFSPQHGLYSEKQANMIGSHDEIELFTQTPVVSLYGPRLEPEPNHLEEIDVVFIDLQEVGCRVYTYIWTVFLVLKRCYELGKRVVVLDRPNPIGGKIEGPYLEEDFKSFVGMDPLPLRHGLTIGELSLLFKKRHFPDLELEVIPVKGYRRSFFWKDLTRPWVLPSPNLPSWWCALVYPGQVLLEGTNLSEGRGTTLPFLVFGAPYLKIEKVLKQWEKLNFPEKKAVVLRPFVFEPTFDKWKGGRCFGFQLYVTDLNHFQPVKTTLMLLRLIKENFPEFQFLNIPYEFEREKRPIDILIGNQEIIDWLEGKKEIDLDFYLYYNLKHYQEEIQQILLYE